MQEDKKMERELRDSETKQILVGLKNQVVNAIKKEIKEYLLYHKKIPQERVTFLLDKKNKPTPAEGFFNSLSGFFQGLFQNEGVHRAVYLFNKIDNIKDDKNLKSLIEDLLSDPQMHGVFSQHLANQICWAIIENLPKNNLQKYLNEAFSDSDCLEMPVYKADGTILHAEKDLNTFIFYQIREVINTVGEDSSIIPALSLPERLVTPFDEERLAKAQDRKNARKKILLERAKRCASSSSLPEFKQK